MVYCYYDSFGRRRCNTVWSSWGRWVLLGIIILFSVFFLLAICCLSRRRAKRGRQPYYGTGWAMGGMQAQPGQNYQYGQQQPVPAGGYYQGQQGGYQNNTQYAYQQGYGETGVTQPKPSYGGDQPPQYQAPPGPPPNQQYH